MSDEILTFDEWFDQWFNHSLVESLGDLRSQLEGVREKMREIRLLWPALDESLDENAAAQAAQDERLRPPSELADMLGQLSAELLKLQEKVAALAAPQREIEVLRRELLTVLGSKV